MLVSPSTASNSYIWTILTVKAGLSIWKSNSSVTNTGGSKSSSINVILTVAVAVFPEVSYIVVFW